MISHNNDKVKKAGSCITITEIQTDILRLNDLIVYS